MAIKPTINEIKNARVTKVVKEFGEATVYKYLIQKGDTEIKIQSPDKLDLVYNDELNVSLIKINQSLNNFEEE